MSIFDDARRGVLVGATLDNWLKTNPTILDEQDPITGWTPLATAVVSGFPEQVEQLMKKGAKLDGRCRDGETPLLLATWKTNRERRLIVQTLLSKMPRESVDSTCAAAANNTPLMFAIEKADLVTIRMLREAGASLKIKNNDGFDARELAKNTENKAISRALNPKAERSQRAGMAGLMISVLLFIVAWVNANVMGIVDLPLSLTPDFFKDTNLWSIDQKLQNVNGPGEASPEEFIRNVDTYINEHAVLKTFFKDDGDFIRGIAQNSVDLAKDSSTDLGSPDMLPKTIQVSMHQQIIYCDDSWSTHRDNRWENQKALALRIADITTRILPEGEGVAVRFINQEVDNSDNLDLEGIKKILDSVGYKREYNTDIGTHLRSRILKPLVYDKLRTTGLARPLLISIITDGDPQPEDKAELANAIVECGNALENAGIPRESVKFMIGQVGSSKLATRFLETLRGNDEIAKVAFITSDKLDDKLSEFHDNHRKLDRWHL
ncbi:hypothetical protein Neosp_004418 [[Neocosmospora] mangrovei]